MDIAKIGNNTYPTMEAAAAAMNAGETLYVTRSGEGAEVKTTFDKPGKFTILGVRDDANNIPTLHLDINTRLAWSKAILNLEHGDFEIGNLRLAGAAIMPACNGAALRVNEGVGIVDAHHLHITDNENGLLTGPGAAELYLSDSVVEGNGKSTDAGKNGLSHDIYVGAQNRFEAMRVTFRGSKHGHELKSRAKITVLNQVECSHSPEGRAMDIPEGGILVGYDGLCYADANAGQRNLVDIMAEPNGDGRPEFYILFNYQFHSDVPVEYDVQYIKHRSSVPLYLVDPLFTGAAAKKDQKQTLVGDIRIIHTGGPLGPLRTPGGDYNSKLRTLPTPTGIPAIPKDISEIVSMPIPTTPAASATASGSVTVGLTPELTTLVTNLVKVLSTPVEPAVLEAIAAPVPTAAEVLGNEHVRLVAEAMTNPKQNTTITTVIKADANGFKSCGTTVTHPK